MSSSRSFVEKSKNSFNEGADDHDKLLFGVFRTPENHDTIVERSFVADLGKTLEVTTQGRMFVSRGRSLFIDPEL